jgi:hypothetical protein
MFPKAMAELTAAIPDGAEVVVDPTSGVVRIDT